MESGTIDGAGPKRVIVEARYGPVAGRKGIIRPGSAIRVGRSDQADLAVPQQDGLSNFHFEVTWDGATCSLSDLDSHNGTFLHGEKVQAAKLKNGDWIRAAGLDFIVYFEAHTPPAQKHLSTLPLAMREKALEELSAALLDAPLYVMLDAARSERILVLLRESVEEVRSLYDGVTADRMEESAPYLVRLREPGGLLTRLVLEGWGKAWGAYLTCKRPMSDIRAQFRKLLMVTIEEEEGGPDPEPVYFRFYDPRVLEALLPILTPRQEDEIFGEIDRFYYEDSDGRLVRAVRTPKSSGKR